MFRTWCATCVPLLCCISLSRAISPAVYGIKPPSRLQYCDQIYGSNAPMFNFLCYLFVSLLTYIYTSSLLLPATALITFLFSQSPRCIELSNIAKVWTISVHASLLHWRLVFHVYLSRYLQQYYSRSPTRQRSTRSRPHCSLESRYSYDTHIVRPCKNPGRSKMTTKHDTIHCRINEPQQRLQRTVVLPTPSL